jgi:hypothetical protein
MKHTNSVGRIHLYYFKAGGTYRKYRTIKCSIGKPPSKKHTISKGRRNPKFEGSIPTILLGI